MTRLSRFLPLAVVAVSILALAACGRGRDDHRLERGETLLTVVGSGHADAAPDEAAFVIGVTAIGASAAEASRLDNEKMQKVMASLRGLGVAQDKIQTRTLTLERIDYGADRGKFRANNSVSARMNAGGKVGEVVVAATQAGANLLSGPTLTVSDPARAGRLRRLRRTRPRGQGPTLTPPPPGSTSSEFSPSATAGSSRSSTSPKRG